MERCGKTAAENLNVSYKRPHRRFFFCCSGARQAVDGAFQVDAFGRGRCTRRGKLSGPTLLEPSLRVKRNTAHTKAPRLSSPRSQGLNARDRLKVCLPPKRPQFGGRTWGHRGKRRGSGPRRSATANHIQLAAAVQFCSLSLVSNRPSTGGPYQVSLEGWRACARNWSRRRTDLIRCGG